MTYSGLLHAIDFGTSYSSIIVSQPDGTLTPIADPAMPGSHSIRTSVCIRQEKVEVGQAAENAKMLDPAAYRSEFKRDFGDRTPTTLASRAMTPDEMAVEVLRFLREQAQNTIPGDPERVVITVPASWEAGNLELMHSAAERAGYRTTSVDLVAEPVAAMAYAFGERHDPAERLTVLIYDLGGGTFDCAIAQTTAGWYEVLGKPGGLDDIGGAAFDRLLLGLIQERFGDAATALLNGAADDPDILRRRLTLKDSCEKLKWQLSVTDHYEDLLSELIPPPWFRLDRPEFEALIRPLLNETISECERLIEMLDLDWSKIDRIVPVGGSSRIPLVPKILADRWRQPVLAIDRPDMAVAHGAVFFGRNLFTESRPRKVFVNEKGKIVHTRDLGFDEIVKLAFENPPAAGSVTFTVTYNRAAGLKPQGSLVQGKSVEVQDGTIFNVAATNRA